MYNYFYLLMFALVFSLNAADFTNEAPDDTSLDLEQIARQVLADVVNFGLRTANSVASSDEDKSLLELVRKNSPYLVSDSGGFSSVSIDVLYNAAKKAIHYGVANCDEYSAITVVILIKYEFLYPDQIKISLQKGFNFNHIFAIIYRPHDAMDDWLAVDPWLGKIIPFTAMPQYLDEALVKVPKGEGYKFKRVHILGDYQPLIHNFASVFLHENRNYISLPRELFPRFNESGYKVPYQGQINGKYVSYDPKTHNEMIFYPKQNILYPVNILDEEVSVYDLLGDFIKNNEEFNAPPTANDPLY